MVFFGANDACLPGGSTGQHVPLDLYKQNLKDILAHHSVMKQKPRLILVTPPPVNEYQLEESGLENVSETLRTAEQTKRYADACRDVGTELGIAVVDLWSVFMAKSGWKQGQTLLGSKKAKRSEMIETLLSDGILFPM